MIDAGRSVETVACRARRGFFLWALGALAVLIADTGNGRAEQHEERRLVGASSNNFPPVNVLDGSGRLDGFGRALADAVVAAIGGQVTHIHSPHWTEVVEWLDTGKADFIHDVGFTKERLGRMDYTAPILEMPENIFVHSERFDITGFEDLRGKTVACVDQHITHLYLMRFPEIKCLVVKRPVDGVVALLDGDADAFIYPRQIVLYYLYSLRLKRTIKIVGKPLRTLSWHMAVKKGNRELRELLDQGIAKVRDSGAYDRIYKKWFGESIFKGHPTRDVVWFVAVAVLLTALGGGLIFATIFALRMRAARDRLAESNALRQRAEREFAESEERFRTIAETTPVAIIISRLADGEVLYTNSRAGRLLGAPGNELLGRKMAEFFEAADGRPALMEKPRRDGGVRDVERRMLRADGTPATILCSLRVVEFGGEKAVVDGFQDITERKRAEEELRESEARYSAIVEDQTELISRFTADGIRTFISEATCRFYGKEAEELIGASIFEPLHEDDLARLKAYLSGFTPDAPVKEFEGRVLRRDGEYRWIHWTARALFDADGEVREFQSVGRDVTERKEMETVSVRLTAAIDSISDLVAIYDADDRLFFCNKKFREYSEALSKVLKPGASFETITRALVADDAMPDAAGGEEEWLAERMAMHKNPEGPVEVARRDGTWVRLHEQRLPDGGTATLLSDVTERKRAEEALRDSESLLQTIVGNVADGVITLEENGTILSFTRNAEITFGYAAEEVIGKSIGIMIPESVPGRHGQYLARYVDSGEKHVVTWLRGMTALRKDGSEFPVEIGLLALRQGDKRIFMGTIVDRTEDHRAAAEREELEKQLRQVQKLETLGTLTDGIAHDFNNILAPILGFVEVALGDLSEGTPTHTNLQAVLKASHRARDLVRQILTFGGKSEQERQPTNVGAVVAEALTLIRPSLPATIEIGAKLDEETSWVVGNPTQIHQVAMNLCTNAYQAMGADGGVLDVRVETVAPESAEIPANLETGPYVHLSVSDTGHGMDEATKGRMFEPFYTTKEVDQGSGLGLSVVHGIIVGHGGGIAVDSTPGEGSTFHVYLPLTEARDGVAAKPWTARPPAPGDVRVLYVEDERDIADLGHQMLERLGYQVTLAADSRKALKTFRADPGRFDVVVTDHTMPRMTGAELAAKMRKLRPDLPIVLVTGSRAAAAATAAAAGAKNGTDIGILTKPILIDDLSNAVRCALRRAASA